MAQCLNCGSELRREHSIFRDTEVCPHCGWWCHAPGTGVTAAAAISAFLTGLLGTDLLGPDEDDLQPA